MEPEFERANTPPKTRPRSSEELLNDGPVALRRRVREGWPSCCPVVQKSISQPRRSGGNNWCKNGLSNLRHRRIEHSPVMGFVRTSHGQVG